MVVAVTSGSDVYGIKEASRMVVRTSDGTPYVAVHNETQQEIEVYKGNATVPTSFSIQDSGNSPGLRASSHDNYAPCASIDANDVIHIVWYEHKGSLSQYGGPVGVDYITFSTSTDTFGTRANIANTFLTTDSPPDPGVASCITENYHHVVFSENRQTRGKPIPSVYYISRHLLSSAWGGIKTVGLNHHRYPDIAAQPGGVPIITAVKKPTFGAPTVEAWIANQENATSFTVKAPLNSTIANSYNICQILVDAFGNEYVGLPVLTTGRPSAIRHNVGDSWATWQAASEAVTGGCDNVSIATRGNGGYSADKNLIYNANDAASKLSHVGDFYQVGGSNWKPQTEVDSGVCNHARMKWSPLHNHGETSLLEWVYEKTDDIYYEYLSLNRTV